MTPDDQPITRRELREELHTTLQHYATKADLAQLETRMMAMEARLVKWMVGMMLGGMVAAAAIASAISNFID